MAKMTKIEGKILKVLRDRPQTPDQVMTQIASGGDTKVQDAIVSLVDQGKLVVTLDWKLRAKEAS